jgi:hypothetical protein
LRRDAACRKPNSLSRTAALLIAAHPVHPGERAADHDTSTLLTSQDDMIKSGGLRGTSGSWPRGARVLRQRHRAAVETDRVTLLVDGENAFNVAADAAVAPHRLVGSSGAGR